MHLLSRTRIVVALGLAAIVGLLGVLTRPNPPSLSTVVTGEAALAARARPLLAGALDQVSIAVIEGSMVTYAGFGADEHTEYEIGSLTKTMTGMLLADAIERGEVTADTQIGALLPLAGAPVADVTLAELAGHRSGLSAHGMLGGDALRFVLRYAGHRNPFTHDLEGLLAIARKAVLPTRGEFVYSNLGAALLGQGLAAAAQMDYDQLVQQRVFTPLGMAASRLPLTVDDLPSGAPTGYSATGYPEAPWAINGWAPAGGTRSTAADMAGYARALLDGSAPGMDALTPHWTLEALQVQVGYAWIMQDYQSHTLTYANGLTGGFVSKIILDRDQQRAVVILSNTAASVDLAAKGLLLGDNAWTYSP
jgi:CubicO group peptidase (beta-lactamase class C family)